jgi:pimeloyl-ACP methyl ester carboxylesterase
MPESFCRAGDIEVCFETFGNPEDPALLLVMGLAMQMLGWHEDLCEELAGRGFFVIRYDNRDVGRSTRMTGSPPTTWQLIRRDKRAATYQLNDMANDGVAILDHLGIAKAHVVGASMGGMIAQTLVAQHADRALSLTSIMSNTGAMWSGQPKLGVMSVLLGKVPTDREAYLERIVKLFSMIGSPGFPPDEEELRKRAGMAYDRGINPAGSARQLAAIIASGDRSPMLASIHVPTLVIHGDADRLVAPSGGKATARAIPGARLLTVEGMGHDIPRALWPRLVDAIVENAGRAVAVAPPQTAAG